MTLSEPSQFVETLTAHDIDPTVFCTYLLYTGAANNNTVTQKEIAAEFDIDPNAADRLLQLASNFGLVIYDDHIDGTEITVHRQKTLKFLQFVDIFRDHVTEKELELLAKDGIHDVDLHIAVPPSFTGESTDLMARLTRLVRNAEQTLLVVTPFFTRFGVDAFVNHLAQATKRGVTVTILTRDATGDGDNVGHVNSIYETVNDAGDIANLRVYDYAPDNGRLHAKALIADKTRAYVGSANLTTYSLREAIEIGLLVQGPVIQELMEFFDTVMSSSATDRLAHPTTE